jgi:hypothetical protein
MMDELLLGIKIVKNDIGVAFVGSGENYNLKFFM